MKTIYCLCVMAIVLGISAAAFQASDQEKTPAVRMFDAFEYMNHENYSAHLDGIAIQLQNEPTSQGYFVFYNGRDSSPGNALRYAKRLHNYMVIARGIEPARIVMLAGGRREEISVEFWIGPPGSATPVIAPTLPTASPDNTKSYRYDSYSYDCDSLFRAKLKAPDYFDDCGYAGMGYENQSARLDGLAAAISQLPQAKAYLIVYRLRRDKQSLAQKFIQKEKNYLVKTRGLKAADIVTVPGRPGKGRIVELWIVPPGAPVPHSKLPLRLRK